ncbi:membrane protein [Streptomyces hydrogenans]|uniref:Membrane protein n=1 Tax=Streptomyces hydrogenans TaxID=1873719 RepID=A0ABQ3P8B8_9ACTN|nr:membrane protein [Streptomyces hydrogenans]GHI21263.1 membrane protein [Streptomyces hydrogenans]
MNLLDSMGSLRSLTAGPWIYPVVATSILLDVFLPVLPSGFLVISAATAASAALGTATASADVPSLLPLLLTAAAASMLGDFLAYRLALRGGRRLDRAIGRSRRLTVARERLGTALARGGGLIVVLARFAPAGRSVVSLGAGAAGRRPEEFLPWSALAAVIWASYSVGLGWLGGQWLGATWFSAGVSTLALLLAGGLAGYLIRRPGAAPAPAS